MKKCRDNSQQGQLAIGIAFAFTAFLAMFGMIFNSSWLVREKMQLQQATDYAALRGAYVQKLNLEYIADRNNEIQNLYKSTHILLQPTYCYLLMASTPECSAVKATSATITGKTPVACSDACSNFDAFVRGRILNFYNARHKQLVSEILSSVTEANAIAFEESKQYFFSPDNLPFGLRRYLEKRLGGSFTSKAAAEYYDRGNLNDIVHLNDAQQDPEHALLFNATAEEKIFSYPIYTYPADINSVASGCYCVPLPVGAYPMVSPNTAKIVRVGDEHTTFMIGSEYMRPETEVERTIRLVMKNPNDEKRKELTTDTGQEANLFRREGYPMVALSLAKPFGGVYPKAGNKFIPFDIGEVGSNFEGIKMIGLADVEEQGTKVRSYTFDGAPYGLQPITMQEILH